MKHLEHLIIAALMLTLGAAPLGAQTLTSLAEVLNLAEQNNAELKALRSEADLTRADARTEAVLPDPEVSFGYLWHERKDVSVTQGLDWATISGRRRTSALAVDSLAEASYLVGRQSVMMRIRMAYVSVVYGNALLDVLEERLDAARRMEGSLRASLAAGNARQTELSAAVVARASALAALSRAQAERDESLAQLAILCGGGKVNVVETELGGLGSLGGDFETWYAESAGGIAALAVAEAEMNVASAQSKVESAKRAPQIAIGYMGEFTPSDHYEGVTVGISVPLWSAKRSATRQRIAMQAAERQLEAKRQEVKGSLAAAYAKALMLGRVAAELRETLATADTRPLTLRALEAGQMSAAEAIATDALYYDAATEALTAERDYQMAVAEIEAAAGRY